MSSAIENLLAILDLEPLEVNLFRGRSPQVTWQRVFGGQVVGQALVAACRTVDVAGDHLRRRSHPRRQELYHPARDRDPARPGDLLHGGVVPP
jgi:hypothetical protein